MKHKMIILCTELTEAGYFPKYQEEHMPKGPIEKWKDWLLPKHAAKNTLFLSILYYFIHRCKEQQYLPKWIWKSFLYSKSLAMNSTQQRNHKCKEDLSLEWGALEYLPRTLLMSSLAALSTTGPISTSVKTFDSATHQRRTSAPYGGSVVWSWVGTERHRSEISGAPAPRPAAQFPAASAAATAVSVPRSHWIWGLNGNSC